MGERGFEPPQDYSYTALNRARLPIPPLALHTIALRFIAIEGEN